MRQRTAGVFLLVCGLLLAVSPPVSADEKKLAIKAAQLIMSALGNGQYNELWNSQTSQFFQKKVTKDSFLANMSISRAQLGGISSSKIVDIQYAVHDSSTGYQGQIYSVTFLNDYDFGKFYERIVVVKDDDGQFRLAGLWGAPAPN